jgi:hypothetical protein
VAATAPYTLSGTLSFPPDTGQPVVALPFSASGNFTSKEEAIFNLTGSGTQSISLGTIPGAGAKAVMIKVDAGTGLSPVTVKVNGSSTGQIEVSPGGFLVLSNPTPTSGITQLDIVYSSNATVRVTVLGD